MNLWLWVDGRQYYQGAQPDGMDRKASRRAWLLDVGDLDMGNRVTNVSASISLEALAAFDPPPRELRLYSGESLLFSGVVDTIEISSEIRVTARA